MNALRLVWLIQPLLALLLLAGAPVGTVARSDGTFMRGIERAAEGVAGPRERAVVACPSLSEPERLDGDSLQIHVLAASPQVAIDRARSIEIDRPSYPTAPPSHRPCAAPPTGPPLA
jgi:hypothetical protein